MAAEKLDILAFAAHPDDAELACSGTLLKHVKQGKKVGVVDLTQGDLGTRGTVDIRMKEAEDSAKILGLTVRENLKMPDGFFEETNENLLKIISAIRKYKPEIVLANAVEDRHPDHGRGGKIVSRACFLSGLRRIETRADGEIQQPWRPKNVYHYIQFRYIKPDFVVDISGEWEQKVAAIKAFKSQFYNPESDEPATLIASENFMRYIEARALEMGSVGEVKYGEGFTVERPILVNDLFNLG
ncbi:MAG: bacillithiol biosynthesis deacetylase BshB1 [Flavobacteriales bacterium]|nr:bacillithiol biosynthesis deacetylase BshB1 [Flavobacteriales bacterium]